MLASRPTPERRAFNHFLRSGQRFSPEAFSDEVKGNPNHDPKNGQFTFGPGDSLRRPSPEMMNEATNTALSSIGSKATTRQLTSEFSQVNNPPDFSKGGWKPAYSSHTPTAYEHLLPDMNGMTVKIYVGDKNFGGTNTATISA